MTARHYLTIAEASRQIAARDLSPVELTKTYLDRAAAIDDRLHAYVLLAGEAALEARAVRCRDLRGGRIRQRGGCLSRGQHGSSRLWVGERSSE